MTSRSRSSNERQTNNQIIGKAEAQRILPFGNNRFDMPYRLIGVRMVSELTTLYS